VGASKDEAVYGFKSLDQAKKWFTDLEVERMEAHGFTLYIYNVDDRLTYSTKRQVVFKRPVDTIQDRVPALW
jgi:hypothetical protein